MWCMVMHVLVYMLVNVFYTNFNNNDSKSHENNACVCVQLYMWMGYVCWVTLVVCECVVWVCMVIVCGCICCIDVHDCMLCMSDMMKKMFSDMTQKQQLFTSRNLHRKRAAESPRAVIELDFHCFSMLAKIICCSRRSSAKQRKSFLYHLIKYAPPVYAALLFQHQGICTNPF
jgi:hypothetical protein